VPDPGRRRANESDNQAVSALLPSRPEIEHACAAVNGVLSLTDSDMTRISVKITPVSSAFP
jgi:hypothetical protein